MNPKELRLLAKQLGHDLHEQKFQRMPPDPTLKQRIKDKFGSLTAFQNYLGWSTGKFFKDLDKGWQLKHKDLLDILE